MTRGTHNDRPVLSTRRTPNDVWRASWHNTTRTNDDFLGLVELGGVRRDLVVSREPAAVSGVVTPAILEEHEVIPITEARDGGHTGAVIIDWGRSIVDGVAPGKEVLCDLVRQLLAVVRVALISVVGDELVLVDEEEGLPDWCLAVVWDAAAAGGDAGDEGPGLAVVAGGVDVDFGLAEVGGEGVAGAEDGALFEFANGFGEDVEEGLVAQTPAVYGVVDLGEGEPGLALVYALEDGVVDNGWLGGVVLPGWSVLVYVFNWTGKALRFTKSRAEFHHSAGRYGHRESLEWCNSGEERRLSGGRIP